MFFWVQYDAKNASNDEKRGLGYPYFLIIIWIESYKKDQKCQH